MSRFGGRKFAAFVLTLAVGTWLAYTGIQAGVNLIELATVIGAATAPALAIYSVTNVQAKKATNGTGGG